MLTVTVVCVGSLKEAYLRDAVKEYEKRLAAFCRYRTVELKDGAPILPALPDRAFRIALCVEGKQLSSEELATLVDSKASEGFSEIVFVIGPFDGLPEEVKKACHLRLSFSKITFTHQWMRALLAEQVYRAFTILSGGKYHK